MFQVRRWIAVLCFVSLWLSSSLAAGAPAETASPTGSAKAATPATPAPRSPRITQASVPYSDNLTGTLSGLARDPGGFYWSTTDGGPATPDWQVRLVKLKMSPSGARVLEVSPLKDEQGNIVTGDKLDPEDVTVAPDGTLWLVDEIYPAIVQVSREGQILRRVEAPPKYKARVKGRGFEGAAMSPDGQTLYIILQTGLSTETDPSHTWLLAYDLASGTFKEYPYQLDKPADYSYPAGTTPWIGANGLAAVGPNELLVIERDNLSGAKARVKRLYKIQVPAEPTDKPLEKTLYLDLLPLGYSLEKLEGVTVANRNSVLVINDNDGDTSIPTVIWDVER